MNRIINNILTCPQKIISQKRTYNRNINKEGGGGGCTGIRLTKQQREKCPDIP